MAVERLAISTNQRSRAKRPVPGKGKLDQIHGQHACAHHRTATWSVDHVLVVGTCIQEALLCDNTLFGASKSRSAYTVGRPRGGCQMCQASLPIYTDNALVLLDFHLIKAAAAYKSQTLIVHSFFFSIVPGEPSRPVLFAVYLFTITTLPHNNIITISI